ncbi:MAG: hypothetical protein QXI60_06930 [Thermofilaceae archaeon]
MPRINNSVLWFDDIKFVNEGILDTPFGRISVRQLIILGVFALPAWLVFTGLEGADIILRVLSSASILFFGVILAAWRVKTVPPERTLALMLGIGRKRPGRKAVRGQARGKRAPKREAEPPVKTSSIHAVVGEAVKITGVLRDPQTGMPLANRQFSVIVDGRLRYRDASDETGAFEVVFLPEQPGVSRIEVAPDGYAFSEKIEVIVGAAR